MRTPWRILPAALGRRAIGALIGTAIGALIGTATGAPGAAHAAAQAGTEPEPAAAAREVVLVIHGGAGTILRAEMTAEREAEYRAALEAALRTGFAILEAGGTALDAVEATIRTMEDSPLFNAGKGAVFTAEGRNEMDASIMEGHTLRAGAVAAVTTIKNPIAAARAVMERTPHVMLAGPGAEQFAREAGLETAEPSYFWTERRWRALEKARSKELPEKEDGGDDPLGEGFDPQPPPAPPSPDDDRVLGTVGALALDRAGHLAAATSTGGLTNKRYGRVGDTPVIGAGTYADARCAVSGTGHGEYFMRYTVARDICARAAYRGLTLEEAARQVVMEVLVEAGGRGGVIALDADGNVAMPFNTEGMYRGLLRQGARPVIEIYGTEAP